MGETSCLYEEERSPLKSVMIYLSDENDAVMFTKR